MIVPLCTYLLPIRRVKMDHAEVAEFKAYFRMLQQTGCRVLVVDGSPAEIFAQHHAEWVPHSQHVPADNSYGFMNGKVNGIYTGVHATQDEKIIVADDDIRYSPEDIARICALLDSCDLVRPQNYFKPLPFWARMEAARMLFNRAFLRAGDYPGTCAFLRSTFLRIGVYDGDVLFDNEEMVRHFVVSNTRICYATDFFILKKPPVFKKWLEQRPRQAYEDFVMILKTAFFLSVLPMLVLLVFVMPSWSLGVALCAALISILICARGLRNGASKFFSPFNLLFAPLWVLERSFSVYLALYWLQRHGGYPFGDRVLRKGTGREWVAGGKLQRVLTDEHA